MKIALCQVPVLWESPEENLRNYDKIVEEITLKNSGTDIIIFPEFFSVGFSMNKIMCESLDGISANWLRQKSSGSGIAFLASVPIKEDDKLYNRAIFVTPDGFEYYYDKRHVFGIGGESNIFSPGANKVIIPYRGWNIMIQICYDLRFPVWSRNIDLGYDLVINVANWPATRAFVIEPMVKTRAIENLTYYAFVNRIGEDPENSYDGNSMVADFKGNSLMPSISDISCYYSIFELDLNSLKLFRNKFPVWKDADKFTIEN